MEENKNSPLSTNDTQQQNEPLNPSSTDEPIAASKTISELEQPSTLNLSTEALAKVDLKPSTLQEMEVHHHTHASHGKKNWKSYFWEFLMLFLAVLCGFFAEYQLEHKIERDRAHQFLQSMLVDVRTNIKNLDSLLYQDKIIIAKHDVLVNWLIKDSATINRAAFAKKMGAVWVRNFLVRKETYEQMKSSGSLRYVGNIEFL